VRVAAVNGRDAPPDHHHHDQNYYASIANLGAEQRANDI
jgi:hypothetical protein